MARPIVLIPHLFQTTRLNLETTIHPSSSRHLDLQPRGGKGGNRPAGPERGEGVFFFLFFSFLFFFLGLSLTNSLSGMERFG